MRYTSLVMLLFFSLHADAQYYYQDIVNNQNNHQLFQNMKKEKISSVRVTSREASGEPTEGFFLEQHFSNSYSQLRTVTKLPGASQSTLVNYYNQKGMLYRTVDSSDQTVTAYEYQYNDSGALVKLSSSSRAANEKNRYIETHEWQYGLNGLPEKMLRVRNVDTLEVRLKQDDKGNVAEEEHYRKGVPVNRIYYYYDDGGRLTDVVRFRERSGRLIPDYTFNYNSDGRLSEMMVVQNGGLNYLTWTYTYNTNGLKTREACYDRQKKLLGSMEYSYSSRK